MDKNSIKLVRCREKDCHEPMDTIYLNDKFLGYCSDFSINVTHGDLTKVTLTIDVHKVEIVDIEK